MQTTAPLGGLIRAWTLRTIRARYQQSLLGWLWAIVQPATAILILTVVFTRIVRVDTGDLPYALFSCVAVVPWAFLTSSLTDMTESFVQNMSLITKSAFRREAIPLAAMGARLMDFLVSLALVCVLFVFYGHPLAGAPWVMLPVVLLVQGAVIVGVGLTCASLNVFYRDVRSIVALVLQLWFYASPIIYPTTLVPAEVRGLYMLNPMAGVLQAYRDILLRDLWPGPYFVVTTVVALALLAMGIMTFRRLNVDFADVV